jgi:hypothetical protein
MPYMNWGNRKWVFPLFFIPIHRMIRAHTIIVIIMIWWSYATAPITRRKLNFIPIDWEIYQTMRTPEPNARVDNRKICPICLKRELHLILRVKCSKWSQMIKRINRMILIIR